MIYISEKAQKYLEKLLTKQKKGTQIRIFIDNLGSINAICKICYYEPNKIHNSNNIKIQFQSFSVYFNKNIAPFIQNTKIDLISNTLKTQLILKSPNLHKSISNTTITQTNTTNIPSLKTLEKRIKNIFDVQINPQLSMHGGSVSLIKITKDLVAIIQFHGGCNGCAMSYYTIKMGIENTLKKTIPELSGVIDATQHQHGSHSFY